MLSEEKKEVRPAISINPNFDKNEQKEIIISLIDTVENWLEEKGITKDILINDEREEDDDKDALTALIYGSDYGYLFDEFESILNGGD